MSRQGRGGGGGGGEDTHKKILLTPRRPKYKVSTQKHMTAILPGSAASTRCLLAQGNAHSHVHTHTHLHQQSGEGARWWLLCSFALVRTNFFFSTTTVSAGFYKSTFLSRLVKHKQWEPKTQLWNNIDMKINHRYFLFFLFFFFFSLKWTFSPSDIRHSAEKSKEGESGI